MAMKGNKISAEDKKREMQWKVESAMRTINEYNNIMKNKALMGEVKKAAMDQVKMLGGIVGNNTSNPTRKLKK
jgi:capsular polysaccharide biosynthesis protein